MFYYLFMLQVIGTKKNINTRKALMYLKERRIPFQFVNLDEYKLKKKEIDSIYNGVKDKNDLIDTSSSFFKKNGYEYKTYNIYDEISLHNELLYLPLLRNGNKVCIGFSDDFIKENLC